jgi:HK97 family phage major capsid protein
LAVFVKVSRELLQDSPNIDEALERSFSESFAVEFDRVGLLGAGAAEPVGLRNESNINEVSSVGGLLGYDDVLDAYKLLLDDNAPDPTAYITSVREWHEYATMKDGDGLPLRKPPAIEDLPFMSTSAIPTNLGGGTESVSFLGYFPDFIFGVRSEFQLDVAKELFAENHQYGFFAHLRMDTAVFHAESFCKLTGITP